MPVYGDPSAPGRLSQELEALPREARFGQWYARFRTFETGHKWFSDFDWGLMASGAALWLARLILRTGFTKAWLMTAWVSLWLLRIPFTWWYYGIRQERFDYPVWGDSVAIPIVSEWIAWAAGCLITLLILITMPAGQAAPETFRLQKPEGSGTWLRASFLCLWIAGLIWMAGESVYFGDEDAVISGTGAATVLLRVLSSERIPTRGEPQQKA